MVVLGSNAIVLNDTGKTADVQPFSSEYDALPSITNIDDAVLYEELFTLKTYVLVFKNALYVPTMNNNLVPPFIMREAGLKVKDIPKIQLKDPTVEDHSIYFKDHELRIPLQLHGILSYFTTSRPSEEQLRE
eukprot:703859-Ditylum_brightwellii.AAC.1